MWSVHRDVTGGEFRKKYKKYLKNTFRCPALLWLGFGLPTQETGRQIQGNNNRKAEKDANMGY